MGARLPPRIDFGPLELILLIFLCYLVVDSQNQFLPLELILEEVKIFYYMSKSLLEELSNINHFMSKLILTKSIPQKQNQTHTKSIPIKLIIFKINFTKAELNTLYDSHFKVFISSCLRSLIFQRSPQESLKK